MGRGGPFTALFGLFVFMLWLGGQLLFYTVVILGTILLYIGQGIRWLWRRHKYKKAIRNGGQALLDEPIDPRDLPKPLMTPVEYHNRKEG